MLNVEIAFSRPCIFNIHILIQNYSCLTHSGVSLGNILWHLISRKGHSFNGYRCALEKIFTLLVDSCSCSIFCFKRYSLTQKILKACSCLQTAFSNTFQGAFSKSSFEGVTHDTICLHNLPVMAIHLCLSGRNKNELRGIWVCQGPAAVVHKWFQDPAPAHSAAYPQIFQGANPVSYALRSIWKQSWCRSPDKSPRLPKPKTLLCGVCTLMWYTITHKCLT